MTPLKYNNIVQLPITPLVVGGIATAGATYHGDSVASRNVDNDIKGIHEQSINSLSGEGTTAAAPTTAIVRGLFRRNESSASMASQVSNPSAEGIALTQPAMKRKSRHTDNQDIMMP